MRTDKNLTPKYFFSFLWSIFPIFFLLVITFSFRSMIDNLKNGKRIIFQITFIYSILYINISKVLQSLAQIELQIDVNGITTHLVMQYANS